MSEFAEFGSGLASNVFVFFVDLWIDCHSGAIVFICMFLHLILYRPDGFDGMAGCVGEPLPTYLSTSQFISFFLSWLS